MRYIEIDKKDFVALVEALTYVIERYKKTDTEMAKYLNSVLTPVLEHYENEIGGSEIASEIEDVLEFVGSLSEQT